MRAFHPFNRPRVPCLDEYFLPNDTFIDGIDLHRGFVRFSISAKHITPGRNAVASLTKAILPDCPPPMVGGDPSAGIKNINGIFFSPISCVGDKL